MVHIGLMDAPNRHITDNERPCDHYYHTIVVVVGNDDVSLYSLL